MNATPELHLIISVQHLERSRNAWLALPKRIGNRSLTSFQQRLVKAGRRLVKHARYYWPSLAESHLTKQLFDSLLWRIVRLSHPAGKPRLREPQNRSKAKKGRKVV